MKSIKAIIGVGLLMLGAIGFASCSQEEDDAVIQEKGNLLKIRTSVADSRGVITGTTFQQGDEIGICVTTVDGHDYTGNSQNIRGSCVRMRLLYMPIIHTMLMLRILLTSI